MYARTHLELFSQMARSDYPESDLACVLRAYETAVHLFSARFQPSGAPFLAHLVRTASILAAERLPAAVVAAGLLHTAYGRGDFGDGHRGFSERRRRALLREVGEEVERHVTRYRTLRWTPETIPLLREGLDALGGDERHPIAMKLASELEHQLDGEILYYGGVEPLRFETQAEAMAGMADVLGLPGLAAELRRVRAAGPVEIPAPIRRFASRPRAAPVIRIGGRNESETIVPRSYGRRWSVRAAGALRRLAPRRRLRELLERRDVPSSGGRSTGGSA